MKIALLTFYNEAIADYGDITSKINELYCKKHNITWIISTNPKYTDRHPAWENLPMLLTHIDDYDYVVWIDADAFFYVDGPSIEEFIMRNNETDFIFSRDLGNRPPPFGEINTGIFVAKKTEYSKKFLKLWAYDEELYRNNTMKYRWDQGVLNDMYRQNVMDVQSHHHSIVLEYGALQHFERDELGTFTPRPLVYHMAGRRACGRDHERVEHSREYYDQIKYG